MEKGIQPLVVIAVHSFKRNDEPLLDTSALNDHFDRIGVYSAEHVSMIIAGQKIYIPADSPLKAELADALGDRVVTFKAVDTRRPSDWIEVVVKGDAAAIRDDVYK